MPKPTHRFGEAQWKLGLDPFEGGSQLLSCGRKAHVTSVIAIGFNARLARSFACDGDIARRSGKAPGGSKGIWRGRADFRKEPQSGPGGQVSRRQGGEAWAGRISSAAEIALRTIVLEVRYGDTQGDAFVYAFATLLESPRC